MLLDGGSGKEKKDPDGRDNLNVNCINLVIVLILSSYASTFTSFYSYLNSSLTT